MTEICLVRHGETDWNLEQRIQGAADVPLNETGRRQAADVGEYLSKHAWDFLYSSPLSRAYETAKIIASRVGLDSIYIEERLKERNFGEAEGIHISERKELYSNSPIPGAETREEVQERAFDSVKNISCRHSSGRILIVAHGGFISGLLRRIGGDTLGNDIPPLKNGCLNYLTYDEAPERWTIQWFNRVIEELEIEKTPRS